MPSVVIDTLAVLFLSLVCAFVLVYLLALVLRLFGLEPGSERLLSDAERRAERLLQSCLTPTEQAQLRTGFLEVPSRLVPGRTYRIARRPQLVDVLERGVLVERLCLQPETRLPSGDLVLLHKLLIEGSEAEYLKRANHLVRGPGGLWRWTPG